MEKNWGKVLYLLLVFVSACSFKRCEEQDPLETIDQQQEPRTETNCTEGLIHICTTVETYDLYWSLDVSEAPIGMYVRFDVDLSYITEVKAIPTVLLDSSNIALLNWYESGDSAYGIFAIPENAKPGSEVQLRLVWPEVVKDLIKTIPPKTIQILPGKVTLLEQTSARVQLAGWADTGDAIAIFSGDEGKQAGYAFSPTDYTSESLVYSGDPDGAWHYFDLQSNVNHSWVMASVGTYVRIWEIYSGLYGETFGNIDVTPIQPSGPVDWSPSGQFGAFGEMSGRIPIIDWDATEITGVITGTTDSWVSSIAFGNEETFPELYALYDNGSVYFWPSITENAEFLGTKDWQQIVWLEGENAIAGLGYNQIEIEYQSGESKILSVSEIYENIYFSPKNSRLVVQSENRVAIYSYPNGKLLNWLPTGNFKVEDLVVNSQTADLLLKFHKYLIRRKY